MLKKSILLLSAVFLSALNVSAQLNCATDEVNNAIRASNPNVVLNEQKLKQDIQRQLEAMGLMKFTKTTGAFDTVLHVPIVFHIIHDYGSEYVSDNQIYAALDDINQMFSRTNPDSNVIAPYAGNIPGTNVKYRGKANIKFHLPSKDKNGNPTHGIIRHRSYLSYIAGNQSKFNAWPNDKYMNIWVIRKMGPDNQGAAAFALQPATVASSPFLAFYDGVITLYDYLLNDHTVAHELGHSLSLDHPWGKASGINGAVPGCDETGTYDEVDDTPPTHGHTTGGGCSNANLYDIGCILNDGNVAKSSLNPVADAIGTDTVNGIKFLALEKLQIRSLNIYPTDAGSPFNIVVKRDTTVVASYSGVTNKNNFTANNNVMGKISFNQASADTSYAVGDGIKFLTYDSVYIEKLSIYPSDTSVSGLPFTIVLKHNGIPIDSYSDTTKKLYVMELPVHFQIGGIDSVNGYSIEFSINPGMKRDSVTNNYTKHIGTEIKFTDDSTDGRYNFFYNWKVTYGNFVQTVPVNFVLDADSIVGYTMKFAVNPGIKQDTSTGGYTTYIQKAVNIIDDSTNNKYNYFYNWAIRFGHYWKTYSPLMAAALFENSSYTFIDYPDTVNSENVMDYTFCSKMFTHLQAVRMRATLQSPIAGRSNLISKTNLLNTGVTDAAGNIIPMQDLPPVADFSVEKGAGVVSGNDRTYFLCANAANYSFTFRNRSWNDTVTSVAWEFPGDATTPSTTLSGTSINTAVNNKFSTPGWKSVKITATSNAGFNTYEVPKAVYVADPVATPGMDYYQEFNPGGDNDKYPIINHFNNDYKWEFVNIAGYYDNTSIRFTGFDKRYSTALLTGEPDGDYDDFYTIGLDLTGFGSKANLQFYSAGAFTTNNSAYTKDKLEISYSTDCGGTWKILDSLKYSDLGNKGTIPTEFVPGWAGDWKANGILLPAAAKTNKTFFRFRYYASSFGNDFYIDRLHVSDFPTEVNTVDFKEKGMVLAPNPTSGSTFLVINSADNANAQIRVTDITGKVVYTSAAKLTGKISRIEIPASAISVKGIYLVQLTMGNKTQTEKLVVY